MSAKSLAMVFGIGAVLFALVGLFWLDLPGGIQAAREAIPR